MKIVVRSVRNLLFFTLCLMLAPMAGAVPYASGISNNAGTVSFTLNESADNVTVSFDGGGSTLNMGALAAGRHNFPLGAASSFAIQVSKTTPLAWTQIGSDSVLTRYFSARGVAVNTFPSSPHFGRVYVANGSPGTTTVGPAPHRFTGDGIYLLNADMTDAVDQGTNARNAGLNFAPATNAGDTPFRIEVGPDGRLYIADYSTTTGNLYRTDPDVTTSEAVFEGQGTSNPSVHTTIAAPRIFGTLEGGDLVVWAIDGSTAGSFNTIKRWTIGPGPLPWASSPETFASVYSSVARLQTDLDIAPDGRIFASVNRFDGTDSEGLRVFEPDGTTLLFASRRDGAAVGMSPDPFRQTRGIRVSPDGKYVASITDTNGILMTRLVNGIPELTSMRVLALMPGTASAGRDLCFDAAGNLYAVSSGVERMRAFSPGGTTTATTSSDGTFQLNRIELADVSVTGTDTSAAEDGPDAATFTFTRTGDLSAELVVNFTLAGTTTSGTDYSAPPASVTILANEATATFTLTPTDDAEAELVETAILTITPSPSYAVVTPSATATIIDNEFPVLNITSSDTNSYERLSGDPLRFTVTRYGATNTDIFSAPVMFEGVAVRGVDFTSTPDFIGMAPGVITASITVTPIDDSTLEGYETVTVMMDPAHTDYMAGTSASGRIQDDEVATAPVLFADDFENDTTLDWTVLSGANNGTPDAQVEFFFDYSTLNIPTAPHSAPGTTRGVRLKANKGDATGSSAGVNLYPVGQNFSGDYALRFDLFLNVGTASTTEHGIAGINHSGSKTNRATQSADANNTTAGGDGVWINIVTDGSNLRDYAAYSYPAPDSLPTIISNRSASTLSQFISVPPYAYPGSPANNDTSATRSWADVELRQLGGVITLIVNNNTIMEFPNTSGFNSGNIMIGFNDQFDSAGSQSTYGVVDNVRVVNLSTGTTITITDIEMISGNQVQIDFTASGGGQPGEFALESTLSLNPIAWGTENSATIVANGGGFRATVASNGDTRFYRLRR